MLASMMGGLAGGLVASVAFVKEFCMESKVSLPSARELERHEHRWDKQMAASADRRQRKLAKHAARDRGQGRENARGLRRRGSVARERSAVKGWADAAQWQRREP